jgi:hypothetical protein
MTCYEAFDALLAGKRVRRAAWTEATSWKMSSKQDDYPTLIQMWVGNTVITTYVTEEDLTATDWEVVPNQENK